MRVLVTGAGGIVGREVVEALAGHDVIGLDRAALDVGDRDSALGAIGSHRPDAIVHCAAMTAVDACETDQDQAFLVNALGVRFVMEAARRVGAYVVALSTDYVFDGSKS
ncbi:MAG TPA: sugar nucleotide-binding protein, partial [Acidimicrobiia bacterium]|nr:sugar nucleotide-binding protein [Acidimicrobiia bacterium]